MPKINRMLASLVIADLAQNFEFPGGKGFSLADRHVLTKAEAVLKFGREGVGEFADKVRDAFFDHGHPAHSNIRTIFDTCQYFVTEHPQVAGAPAEWTERAPPARDPTKENPFAELNAAEAETLMTWAKGHPDFAGYYDPSNPAHGALQAQVQQVAAIAVDGSGETAIADTKAAPFGAERPIPPAQQRQIGELIKAPAYWDKSLPGHAEAVKAVQRAMAGASSPSPATPPGADASKPRSIVELQRDPAYLDTRNPQHGAVVAEMLRAHESAAPAPAADKPSSTGTPS